MRIILRIGRFFFLMILVWLYLLILAVLGLHRCAGSFFSCGEQTSHCAGLWQSMDSGLRARGLGSHSSRAVGPRLGSRGAQVQWPCGTWGLPRSGIKPTSPALAGGLLPLSHQRSLGGCFFFIEIYLA